MFFHSFVRSLEFCRESGSLPCALRRELLSYGSALLVLKRLEAQHFLVGLKGRRGRNASVPHISAEMRRKHNKDHMQDDFELDFPDLMSSIGELTTAPWQNRTQLVQFITKQVYRGLHDNLKKQHEHFERFRALLKKQNEQAHGIQPRCYDFTLKFHHLGSVLRESSYYALPMGEDDAAGGDAIRATIFQVLALNPGLRQYVQRNAYMTEDASRLAWARSIMCGLCCTKVWKDCIAIRRFCSTSVHVSMVVELDTDGSMIEPCHIDEFYKNDRVLSLLCFNKAGL